MLLDMFSYNMGKIMIKLNTLKIVTKSIIDICVQEFILT
jgi:hypothetical protein